MDGSPRELTFALYRVTVNTKEGAGTVVHNTHGTPGGPVSPGKSDRKKGQRIFQKIRMAKGFLIPGKLLARQSNITHSCRSLRRI